MNSIFRIIINAIKYRIGLFGKAPLCNLCPERAPKVLNFCFLLCWRCTGLLIGAIIGKLLFGVTNFQINQSYLRILFVLILVLPVVIDSVLQYYFGVLSTNKRRCLTGIIAGIGATLI